MVLQSSSVRLHFVIDSIPEAHLLPTAMRAISTASPMLSVVGGIGRAQLAPGKQRPDLDRNCLFFAPTAYVASEVAMH